jgi:hypothetical protein
MIAPFTGDLVAIPGMGNGMQFNAFRPQEEGEQENGRNEAPITS